MTSEEKIKAACAKVEAMLLAKNLAYGDSAFNPVRILSSADPAEQLRVRIDDKLSRIVRGRDDGENTLMDLAGYLILLLAVEQGG